MSCRRALEIEAAAYLVEPRAPEWRAFRAHFPSCPDCSAAVASWTELEQALRARARAAEGALHPLPPELAAFDASPGALPAGRRGEITRHLETCARCADELAALRGFDFGALAAGAPPPPRDALRGLARAAAAQIRSLADRLRSSAGEVAGAIGPEPALAVQSAEPPAATPNPVAVLVGLGAYAGRSFPLFQGESRLGRAPEAELRLRHGSVPRVAARLRVSGDSIEVEELARDATLRVNGARMSRSPLRDGDRVGIGAAELELRLIGGE
jgi:anti-sigma factor RsiW